MYMWIILLLLLYQTGRGDLACYVTDCDPYECTGWQCTKCKDSFYINGYFCSQCKSTCTKCTSYQQCSECQPYYYGSSCQDNCRGCSDTICSENNGTCSSHCIAGYYVQTNNMCAKCRTTCKKCNDYNHCTEYVEGKYLKQFSGGYYCITCRSQCSSCSNYTTCTQCKQSLYWGTYCQNNCEYCISNCDKHEGCSEGCIDGYFKTYSLSKGGYECKRCPSSCITCTGPSSCQTCKSEYWGSICQNNCLVCQNKVCDKYRGCTFGCINKHFLISIGNEFYCSACHANCETCVNSDSCSSCRTGFNGSLCQHDCRSCDDQICDWETGKCSFDCSSSQYFDEGQKNCLNCPDGCTSCTSSISCDGCSSGRWGDVCQNNCNDTCRSNICNKNNGRCLRGCNDGFLGNNCSLSCLPGCKSCNNGTSCHTCKNGYFDRDNNFECECTTEYCVSATGDKCTQCSTAEWYPHTSGCCPCSSDCENSLCFNNGTCINCNPGKYGDQCKLPCSSRCRDGLCYRDSSCISCLDGLYGPDCNKYCSSTISRCNTCYGQDAYSVTCTRCNNGWYVENNNCKSCNSHCRYSPSPTCNSTTGTCRAGCKTGYYGEKCDSLCNVTNCLLCPTDHIFCQECKHGFYGETEYLCAECSAYYRDGIHCNKYNGSCTSGCIDGWTGDQCNQPCPSGCIICEQYNSSSCDECSEGVYGDQCEKNCSQKCKNVEGKQACNRINGYCEHGCRDNFWGYACENDCGAGCSESVCNRTTGKCMKGCIIQYYGDAYMAKCSKNCLSRGKYSRRNCSFETGECLFGCETGWFGPECDKKCSEHCNGSACERNSGLCTFGCIEGYSGSSCSKAIVSTDGDSTNVAAIGGGAGAGIGILVTVAVVVTVVLWRRRQQRSETANNHLPGESQGDDQQESGYQNLLLNMLENPAGLGNDSRLRTTTSESHIEVYQELNQQILPENTYSALSTRSAPTANITSDVAIGTAAYQNTCTEASTASNYQELSPYLKDNDEYCLILSE